MRPSRPPHPVLAGGPLLIGHRGAAGLAPENTMPSFRLAVETWEVDMIELDVHATADGHCVVIHDPTTERTCDRPGVVAEMTLAELRGLDFGYGFAAEGGEFTFRGQGISVSTFDEVLEEFPDTRFTAEVKTGAAQEPLFETIRRHDATDRVIAAGLSHRDRDRFGEYDGAISGSMRDVRRFYTLHLLHLARFRAPDFDVFQVPEHYRGRRIVRPRFIRDAARHGVPVHIWTVNETADMARLLDWGVDGIITDRPDRAARLMVERFGRPSPPGLEG